MGLEGVATIGRGEQRGIYRLQWSHRTHSETCSLDKYLVQLGLGDLSAVHNWYVMTFPWVMQFDLDDLRLL